MKIQSVKLYYLAMPKLLDISDGSQDALLVRIEAGGHVGWGECECSPLTSIAAWCCPMSHFACKPVQDAVLGETIDSPADIERISRKIQANGVWLLQTDHMLSGIDIALWDLLGKARNEPVYRLLGAKKAYPKLPYASQLFGDTPQQTLVKAKQSRAAGFKAAKFGWGPFGHGDVETDAQHIAAAREGLGSDSIVLIDAGTVWYDNVEQAALRLSALKAHRVTWLEEPFISSALDAYKKLADQSDPVKIAGGEGAHSFHTAKHLIDYGGVGFIQIDTRCVGGISAAHQVAQYATPRGVTFVNHSFTSHLALSASVQPFAGIESAHICEYPVEQSDLGRTLSRERLELSSDGLFRLPESPGMGIDPDPDTIRKYLVDVEIKVGGKVLYQTPEVD